MTPQSEYEQWDRRAELASLNGEVARLRDLVRQYESGESHLIGALRAEIAAAHADVRAIEADRNDLRRQVSDLTSIAGTLHAANIGELHT